MWQQDRASPVQDKPVIGQEWREAGSPAPCFNGRGMGRILKAETPEQGPRSGLLQGICGPCGL